MKKKRMLALLLTVAMAGTMLALSRLVIWIRHMYLSRRL